MRKSLVPAPAVIPAHLVYFEVDAVKKLVVGFVSCMEKILDKAERFYLKHHGFTGKMMAWGLL